MLGLATENHQLSYSDTCAIFYFHLGLVYNLYTYL